MAPAAAIFALFLALTVRLQRAPASCHLLHRFRALRAQQCHQRGNGAGVGDFDYAASI